MSVAAVFSFRLSALGETYDEKKYEIRLYYIIIYNRLSSDWLHAK